MKEADDERCFDPQLWHACAGGMVQMPLVRSRVYYFPQGHAEHAHGGGAAELAAAGGARGLPPLVLCCVAGVHFLADPETDEVFAKIRLVPVPPAEAGFRGPEELGGDPTDAREKLSSFSKTLTQSDANNGGGFSLPRYCTETIFPKLDYQLHLRRWPRATMVATARWSSARRRAPTPPLHRRPSVRATTRTRLVGGRRARGGRTLGRRRNGAVAGQMRTRGGGPVLGSSGRALGGYGRARGGALMSGMWMEGRHR